MKNIILLVFYFILSSCATPQNEHTSSDVDHLIKIWKNKLNKDEIIKSFGIVGHEKKANEKIQIEYYFENTTIPKIIFFINDQSKLEGILYLANEQSKNELMNKIPCSWSRSTKQIQRKDIIKELESYTCPKESINLYSNEQLSGFYQVWFGH